MRVGFSPQNGRKKEQAGLEIELLEVPYCIPHSMIQENRIYFNSNFPAPGVIIAKIEYNKLRVAALLPTAYCLVRRPLHSAVVYY